MHYFCPKATNLTPLTHAFPLCNYGALTCACARLRTCLTTIISQKPRRHMFCFLCRTIESIWTVCRSCDTPTEAVAAAAAGCAGCSSSQCREGCSETRKINKLKVLSLGRARVSSGAARPFDLSPESSWDQVRACRPLADHARWSMRTLSTVLILNQSSTTAGWPRSEGLL